MRINTTIGIVGKICSGKSTVASKLKNYYNTPIVSFGSYLFEYSKNNNLLVDRTSLQNLGNKFIQEDSNLFLNKVLDSQSFDPNKIIIEGIRHISIYNELRKMSQTAFFAFIDAPIEIRYQRYLKRQKESDKQISFNEFEEMDKHIVESETDLLKDKCDIILDSEEDDQKVFKYFSHL